MLLVALAVGTMGVPVPSWAGKDTSVPFPCMHRGCGCQNAAACWNSCCCHTNAQKLAWAKKNGVQAPTFVVAAAAREKSANENHPAKSCCSTKFEQLRSCCSYVAKTPPAKSCCEGGDGAKDNSPIAWIRLQDARSCQGQAELWMMLGQVLPAQSDFELDCRAHPQDWLTLRSDDAEILASDPGQRPPRTTL